MGVTLDYNALWDLRSYIIDYGNSVAKKIAVQARDELAREYNESVALFYGSYTPSVHVRQNRLYRGFKKYYHNQHGNVFEGGIIFTAESLGDDYSLPADQVYDMALHGYHGMVSIYTEPTIRDRMMKFADLLFATIDL